MAPQAYLFVPLCLCPSEVQSSAAAAAAEDLAESKSLGAQLRARREALGLTQATLAASAGYASNSAIADLESGRQGNPTLQMLQRLCKTMGCQIEVTAKGVVLRA